MDEKEAEACPLMETIFLVCIRCQYPVDRVFRNYGVRNSEVLLYNNPLAHAR